MKTSLRYLLEKMPTEDVRVRMADLCASYQQAVIDALVRKTRAALVQDAADYRSVGLSGGVANNRALRAVLLEEADESVDNHDSGNGNRVGYLP